MALLSVTKEALEQAKRPAEGWYKVEVVEAKDKMSKADPNKPNKEPSLNCVISIQLMQRMEDGADVSTAEKKKDVYVNYKWFTMNAELLCAMFDVPTLDVLEGKEFDLEKAAVGTEFFAKVKHDIYKKNPSDKGQEIWEFDGFAPLSTPPFI